MFQTLFLPVYIKDKGEEFEERRASDYAGSTSRRIFPALQKCLYIPIYTQIEVFRENSNPALTHSKQGVRTECSLSMVKKSAVAVFIDKMPVKSSFADNATNGFTMCAAEGPQQAQHWRQHGYWQCRRRALAVLLLIR